MAGKRPLDADSQLKDIRRQLSDQLGCLEFRMESKLSLIAEYQEFYKRRGEVEYEYARSLERLCERFERNTKQRNIRNEVRSTFNLWSTILVETRKMSRERGNLAEVMASEMVSRLDIMAKDVQILTKKCKELCVEVQDHFLKEFRDLSEQTKVYHHSCHNTSEAYNKILKSKEKLDATKGNARKKKLMEKDMERQRQYKAQKHLLLKNRNEYILAVARCNALSMQYFNMDIMDIIEYMDFDYHDSYRRLMCGMRDAEYEMCDTLKASADALVDQTKSLNFETDLHYFLSEYSGPFTPPHLFQFIPFQGDDVLEYKVNTEDVFKRAKKAVQDMHEEMQTLKIQREEDVKTIQHMKNVNLRKYQVTSIDDALAVIEENGDALPGDSARDRGNASLERGLSLTTRGGQALQLSQKGKRDTFFFTLGIVQRRVQRADRLSLCSSQLDILDKALDEQKVPPVPVGVDAQGRQIPGEVPKLFGGSIHEYILATGCTIPLIVRSCVKAIEEDGIKMEGLFRVPGPAAYTEELAKGFEEGRDPLLYLQHKPDIAAVASTLKAYFRELSTPLFTTEKYRQFINCTRHEDIQDRLNAIRKTLFDLPPTVVEVMKFLFRFLSRVAEHSSENKMGSANLALVFGPTLTRAPDSIEPRQLHTDVPSVNILIQLCIDQNTYIFGEDEDEEEGASMTGLRIKQREQSNSPSTLVVDTPSELEASFQLTSKVTVLSTSPPLEPPKDPPTKDIPSPTKDVPSPQNDEEVVELASEGKEESSDVPVPPLPPRTSVISVCSGDIVIPPDNEPPPPRPPKQESRDTTPEFVLQEVEKETTSTVSTGERPQSPQNEISQETVEQGLLNLDAAMLEIVASVEGLETKPAEKPDTPASVEAEESDDDSDSDEEVVMKVEAQALYDYTSRSDKELTFAKGDSLQVIEKTADHNWWDGFHMGKRGFIPVSYVEVLDFNEHQSALSVPAPPQRRSSMPAHDAPATQQSPTKSRELPSEPSIKEEIILPAEDTEPEGLKTPDLVVQPPVESDPLQAVCVSPPTVPESVPEDHTTQEQEQQKKSGSSIKVLSKQFQDQPQQPKVLVEPHPTHRRQPSTDTASQQRKGSDSDNVQRSFSGGNRVGMISSVFENKTAAPTPLPPKPKPRIHAPHPPVSSPDHHSQQPPVFPLMSHPQAGAGVPVSPLQRIVQQGQQKPVPADQLKKPPLGKSKPSLKVKRDKSFKSEKGHKPPPKPPPPAKPAIGYVNKELNAELAARTARMKHQD